MYKHFYLTAVYSRKNVTDRMPCKSAPVFRVKYLTQPLFRVWFVTVADTVEIRVNVRTVLDRPVYSMEYRLGPAHAHDADSQLFEPDVRLESTKGQFVIIIVIIRCH